MAAINSCQDRARRFVGVYTWIVAAFVLGGGCVNPNVNRPERAASGPQLAVTAAYLLAPGKPDASTELEELDHTAVRSGAAGQAGTHAHMLRRAFLLLECRNPDAALDAAARVLYGAAKPSANEEAFARYARAEAYTMMGRSEQGQYDRDIARQLALDTELQRRLDVHPIAPGAAPMNPNAVVSVQSRASWRPMEPNRTNLEPMGTPSRLTIHHSALYFRDTRPSTCIAQIQVIQRDHMRNRNYGDIGYHFLIDPSGRIWEGRDLRFQGAHASGANNVRNIGVCLLGNFMRGSAGHGPTPMQVAAMRELVTAMMQRYGFGAEGLHVHNDFKPTECPGPLLEPIVADLARDLRQGGLRTAGATAAGH